MSETRLRKILSDCASALGNGSFASTDSSLKFFSYLPREIRGETRKLRENVKELEAEQKKLRAEIKTLKGGES